MTINLINNFVWCEAEFVGKNKLEFVYEGEKYSCWHIYNLGIKKDEPQPGDKIRILIERKYELVNYQSEVYGYYFKIQQVESSNPYFTLGSWGFQATFVWYENKLKELGILSQDK